jgi:hypothetical protein
MAAPALTAGSTPRKRALFGLLDADGWSWASIKAVFWFILVILLLGYIPDRAYYFTVFSTIDVGLLAVSPVNLCPPENRTLPCPAPPGAVIPWDISPSELALPAPRVDGTAVQAGTRILYIGGTDGQASSERVFVANAFTAGNFSAWKDGPALPAARSRTSAVFLAGSIYVVGGYDAAGKPTTTTWVLTPDAATGELSAWRSAEDLKLPIDLPEARAASSLVAVADGLLLIGGVGPDGSVKNDVWKATLDSKGNLGAWKANVPMVQPGPEAGSAIAAPRADGIAAVSGAYVWVYGGRDANGPTNVVMRGELGAGDQANQVIRWGVGTGASNLPVARADPSGFTANGGLYLVGGSDGTNPKGELYWAVPDSNGNIGEWKHIPASDLPAQGLQGAAGVVNGADAFLIGGRSATGVISSSVRANLAPQPPFFQLGLFGATIPALKIDGEVGQQLGYLAAAGAGTVNFVLLIVIGWALAHKERTRELWDRYVRRRRHT